MTTIPIITVSLPTPMCWFKNSLILYGRFATVKLLRSWSTGVSGSRTCLWAFWSYFLTIKGWHLRLCTADSAEFLVANRWSAKLVLPWNKLFSSPLSFHDLPLTVPTQPSVTYHTALCSMIQIWCCTVLWYVHEEWAFTLIKNWITSMSISLNSIITTHIGHNNNNNNE